MAHTSILSQLLQQVDIDLKTAVDCLNQWFSTFLGPWTIFFEKISNGPLCYADAS